MLTILPKSYDTGQVSGYLGYEVALFTFSSMAFQKNKKLMLDTQRMEDFLRRFGQKNADGSGYHFSNVRSGLIVALVCSQPHLVTLTYVLTVVYWYLDGCFDCGPRC